MSTCCRRSDLNPAARRLAGCRFDCPGKSSGTDPVDLPRCFNAPTADLAVSIEGAREARADEQNQK